MLAEILTIEALATFLVLTALETVLGFDNLLYHFSRSPESGARTAGMGSQMGHRSGACIAHRASVRRPAIDPFVLESVVHGRFPAIRRRPGQRTCADRPGRRRVPDLHGDQGNLSHDEFGRA